MLFEWTLLMRYPRNYKSCGNIRFFCLFSKICIKQGIHHANTFIFLLNHKFWTYHRLNCDRSPRHRFCSFGYRLLLLSSSFLLVETLLKAAITPLLLLVAVAVLTITLPVDSTVHHLFRACVPVSLILILLIDLISLLCQMNVPIRLSREDVPLLLLRIATQVLVDAGVIYLWGVNFFFVAWFLPLELIEGSVIVQVLQRLKLASAEVCPLEGSTFGSAWVCIGACREKLFQGPLTTSGCSWLAWG